MTYSNRNKKRAGKKLRLETLETRNLLSASVNMAQVESYEYTPGDVTMPSNFNPSEVKEILLTDFGGDQNDDLFVIKNDAANSFWYSPSLGNGQYGDLQSVTQTASGYYKSFAFYDITGSSAQDMVVVSTPDLTAPWVLQLDVYKAETDAYAWAPNASSTIDLTDTYQAVLGESHNMLFENPATQDIFVYEDDGEIRVMIQMSDDLTLGFEEFSVSFAIDVTSVGNGSVYSPTESLKSNAQRDLPASLTGVPIGAGDFNGDNVTDFLTSSSNQLNLYVQDGSTGDVSLYDTISIDIGNSDTRIDDLDGNGSDDIIIAAPNQQADNSYRIYFWNAQGSMSNLTNATQVALDFSPTHLALGNLNAGYSPDIMVTGNGYFTILNRNAPQSLDYVATDTVLSDVDYQSVTTYDINGDDLPDLLAASSVALTVRYGQANGTFGSESILRQYETPDTITLADVVGDSAPDLILSYSDAQQIFEATTGVGDHYSQSAIVYSPSLAGTAQQVLVGDMNADGLNDIVYRDNASHISILENQGSGNFVKAADLNLSTMLSRPYVTLVDMDLGNIISSSATNELVILDSYYNDAYILTNQSTTHGFDFVHQKTITVTSTTQTEEVSALAIGNLNADNKLDIAVADGFNKMVYVFYQDTNFDQKSIYPVDAGFFNLVDLAIDDINGDGYNDLVTTRGTGDTITILPAQDDAIQAQAQSSQAMFSSYNDDIFPGVGSPIEGEIVQLSGGGLTTDSKLALLSIDGQGPADIIQFEGDTIHVFRNNIEPSGGNVTAILTRTPTATDSNGETSGQVAGQAWIDEWTTGYVEIWGTIESTNGITSFDTTLEFNSDYFSINTGNISFGKFTPSTINLNGSSLHLTGSTSTQGLGDAGKSVLLARVPFTPNMSNPTGVAITAPTSQHPTSIANGFSITTVAVNNSTSNIINPDASQLWAVPFDTDDNGQVGFSDIVNLIRVYGASVGSTDNAGTCDFDFSGKVDFNDIVAMIRNYGTSKESAGSSTLYYPNGKPGSVAAQSQLADPMMMAASISSSKPSSTQDDKTDEQNAVDLAMLDYYYGI